jgi:hypothetical protein
VLRSVGIQSLVSAGRGFARNTVAENATISLEEVQMSEILAGIFEGVSLAFNAAIEATKPLSHALTKGEMREHVLKGAFRPFVPSRYEMTGGVVTNISGEQSAQQDVLLVDGAHAPLFLQKNKDAVVPVEAVPAILSVKSRATAASVTDAVNNIASVKRLMPEGMRHGITGTTIMVESATGPFGGVVAFVREASDNAILEAYVSAARALPPRERPNALVLLGEMVIAWVPSGEQTGRVWEPEKASRAKLFGLSSGSTAVFLALLLEFLSMYPPAAVPMVDYAFAATKQIFANAGTEVAHTKQLDI